MTLVKIITLFRIFISWTRTSRENGGVGKLNIPLVADISKKISDNFGVINFTF